MALANYVDVQIRINQFWEDYPDGAIRTRLDSDPSDFSVCRYRAEVYKHRDNAAPDAVGYAFEVRQDAGKGANVTSHEENCETSAIGRALANMGYAKDGKNRPSKQEMAKVERAAERATTAPHAPKPANTAPDTPSPDWKAASDRMHAAGGKHGFTHEELRLICDREEQLANKRTITTLKDAPPALMRYVADLIDANPANQRAWIDQRRKRQAELNPDLATLPNPTTANHYTDH